MVWSKWKAAALMTSIACAGITGVGLVYSQQSAARPTGATGNSPDVITINEQGKPPQRAVIQKTFRQADGKNAIEIRNLDTGEVSTMTMSGNADIGAGTSSEVGGKSSVPVNSAPAPVKQQPISGAPKSQTNWQPMPSGPAPAAGPVQGGQLRTVEEPGKTPVKCRVVVEWRTPEGQKAAQLQAVDSGDMFTIVETRPVDGSSTKVTAKLYRWGGSTPPAGVPTAPLNAVPMNAPQNLHSYSGGQQSFAPPAAGQSFVVPQGQGQPYVMPSNDAGMRSSSGKPSLGDHLRRIFGGSPSQSQRTSMAPSKMSSMPMTTYAGMPIESTRMAGSTAPTSRSMTSAQQPAPLMTAVKETPQLIPTPKSTDMALAPNMVKVPDAPKQLDIPSVPDLPKPPSNGNTQWSPTSGSAASPGKPANDPALPVLYDPQPPSVPGGPSLSTLPPLPGSGGPAIAAKVDPLASPESYLPARATDKAMGLGDMAKAAGMATATDAGRNPPGAGAIAATKSEEARYLPGAMPALPGAAQQHPGMASAMQAQQMPELTVMENAFTPAPRTEVNQREMGPMVANAFTSMAAQEPQRPMMMPQPAYNMVPANPAMMASPYGQAPMPVAYYGPMPPNPVPQGPNMGMAQNYWRPVQQGSTFANPAMDRPGLAPAQSMLVQQCVITLQSSILPTQREMAARQLCACDWRINPQIVAVLVTSAKEDPAPVVRVACVAGLSQMGVANDIVRDAFVQLKNDADARVRGEAEQALARMPR